MERLMTLRLGLGRGYTLEQIGQAVGQPPDAGVVIQEQVGFHLKGQDKSCLTMCGCCHYRLTAQNSIRWNGCGSYEGRHRQLGVRQP